MDNRTLANEWLSYAFSDLEAAKFLKNMHPIPLEIICYHCQQSAEKHLKAFIAHSGGEIIRTHDWVRNISLNQKSNYPEIPDSLK